MVLPTFAALISDASSAAGLPEMNYLLFTGATGLLGDYLLRDLLKRDARLAVVVRNSRMETARGRIESLLARWEKISGYALPRPIVLPGDITQPYLGFDAASLEWVAEHCCGVLHNAASLSFEETPDGEPFRSNVTGTQHVLDLCERARIRQFFHVSTAYVSGLREGVIRESELNEGQQPANPYEATKIQAETMVRTATYLDRPTVFRPSIIVGDSISGYTTTYHGFYAPLKSVYALTSQVSDVPSAKEMMHVLGFTGAERKHFIPVDWVSAVMTHVITTPQHHHKTYHLTPDEPISVAEVTESMARCVEKYGDPPKVSSASGLAGLIGIGEQFQELLSAYRSYWRDDPSFVKANTNLAAPHLPCPALTPTLLDRLCRFAIRSNFGWPRPAPIKPVFDLAPLLESEDFTAEMPLAAPLVIGLQVNGPGGGQWTLRAKGGLLSITSGITEHAVAHLYLNSCSMQRIVADPTTIELAVKTGRLLIEGDKQCFDAAVALLRETALAICSAKVAT